MKAIIESLVMRDLSRFMQQMGASQIETASQPVSLPASAGKRLLSLDVLRGVDMAFMIAVNNHGEAAYGPFKHSIWNGWTLTDLVFPTFIFVMGVSLVFSFNSRLLRGEPKSSLLLHTLRRFIILFVLGLVVNGFPYFPLHTLRIYGVLQRIALCYLFASLLELWTTSTRSKIVVLAVSVTGYWILMRYVPIPGYGVPGRDIPLLDPNRNLAAWLDRRLLTGRLFEVTRDPEGLLSTLPAIGTTMLGMLTGVWLRTNRSLKGKCVGLLGAGIACVFLGELWGIWFPINKKLWTSSYVLFSAGCSLLAFALCYWLIEVKQWKGRWTIFWLIFGTNAITAYVFSELLSSALNAIRVKPGTYFQQWYYIRTFAHIQPPGIGSLVFSTCFVLVCLLPVLVLYRKKIFIKI